MRIHSAFLRSSLCLLLGAAGLVSADVAGSEWRPIATMDGITVEARPTPSGFHATRGSVNLCTDLDSLQSFLAEPARFPEWIPYTEEARSLEQSADVQIFYMRTATPWPARSRDMIYRAQRKTEAAGRRVRLLLEGLPDYLPPERSAVRMSAASGAWLLERHNGHLSASLRLEANPGNVPRHLANRRLASTVGGALANLAERFPCPPP